MSASENSSEVGLCSVLFILFLVLKLTGNIDWSWWWVFSPILAVALLGGAPR